MAGECKERKLTSASSSVTRAAFCVYLRASMCVCGFIFVRIGKSRNVCMRIKLCAFCIDNGRHIIAHTVVNRGRHKQKEANQGRHEADRVDLS
jgi:hypothetical protein